MKECSVCKESKSYAEYYKSSRSKTGYVSKCKKCQSLLDSKYHVKHREKYNARQKKNAVENRAFIDRFKHIKGCLHCGEKRPWVLDFHHLGDKDATIADLITYSRQVIKKEIRKCIVLCANCHRDLHYKERSCSLTD